MFDIKVKKMKFYSTRDNKTLYSLREAAFMGLAPDGGLFMPEHVPQIEMKQIFSLCGSSFADMAVYIMEKFFGDSLDRPQIEEAMQKALHFEIPLRKVGIADNGMPLYTLELFHGPTCAFKDVGAGCMGQILRALQHDKKERLTILTATSGDTGSAVARGFYQIDGTDVVVLFPKGKVSPLQECQMTTLGKNVHAVKVNGTFDDCQRLVKEIFNNKELRNRINVTSANSINLLRWLPQSLYYFYGYWQWAKAEHPEYKGEGNAPQVIFVVPSGNYGNISAGMLARKMGLPVKGFVAASNANDIIPQYLKSGIYSPRPSVQTIANAMDVGNPSNYERILNLYGNSYDAICADTDGFSCNDDQIRAGVLELYRKYGYISCPHSAAGYNAVKDYAERSSEREMIWLSTAHPAKFTEVIEPVIGCKVEIPQRLARLLTLKESYTEMEPDSKNLEKFLTSL